MGFRRGNKKRRGLQQGLERHKFKVHLETEEQATLFGLPTAKISQLAEQCFVSVLQLCCVLCVVPLEYRNGVVRRGKWWKFALHYLMTILGFLSMSHKMIVFINVFSSQGLDKVTLLCLIFLFPYFWVPTLGIGNFVRLQETIDLINSWDEVTESLSYAIGKRVRWSEDKSVAIKVIVMAGVVALCPIHAILSMAFPELPVTLHCVVLDLGYGGSMPIIWLQLACFPLELFLTLTIFGSAVGAFTLTIGIGVLKVLLEKMRTMPVTTVEERIMLEKMYICGQIYNKVLDVWYKYVVPLGLLAGGSIMVLGLYVSLRYTHLPIPIYAIFPYITVILGVVAFGLCYEGLVIIRTSDEILGTLKSEEQMHSLAMPPERRLEMLKRSKALRLAYFSVGEFTEFNLGVPTGLWDEVLNQLFFFLTL